MHIDKKLLVELNNNPSLTNCSSHFMKEAGMVETPQLQGGELWQVSGKETLAQSTLYSSWCVDLGS